MNCTLLTILSCLSWSNVYVDSGALLLDAPLDPVVYRTTERYYEGYGVSEHQTSTSRWQDGSNPYGRLAIGMELDFGKIRLSLEGSHTSSLASRTDRGVNALMLNLRAFPFR